MVIAWVILIIVFIQGCAMMNVLSHGKYAAKIRFVHPEYGFTVAKSRHRRAAKRLIWVTVILIIAVLILEWQVRSKTMYIAPVTALFLAHMVFALTFLGTITYLYATTGKKRLGVHQSLGEFIVPASYVGMAVTGGKLLWQMI